MRLNKFIAETGRCSRREADELIEAGRVVVNGARAGVGTQVDDGDDVRIDGEGISGPKRRPRTVYIALNKPVGITCTTERHVDGNIIDFVGHEERIFPIGRLDKESEGLILLTNDGDVVNEVLRAEHKHEKEYLVAVDRAPTEDFLAQMAAGVRIPELTKPCQVVRAGPRQFRITLTQGLNRQIRRMCETLGYEVVALQRTRIMHIHLGHLKVGRWRNLTDEEAKALYQRGPGAQTHSPKPSPSTSSKPKPKPKPVPFGQPRTPPATRGAPRAAGRRGTPPRGGGRR